MMNAITDRPIRNIVPVLLTLLSFLLHGLAMAQTSLYVSPSGNDLTGDGSEADPWRTIQHAIDNAGPGHTIFIMDDDDEATDDYVENITVASFEDLELRRYNDTSPNPQIKAADNSVDAIFVDNSELFSIEGLDIYGATDNNKAAIAISGSNDITVRECRLGWSGAKKNDRGLRLFSVSEASIINNQIGHFTSEGIYLEQVSQSSLSSNTVNNSTGFAVQISFLSNTFNTFTGNIFEAGTGIHFNSIDAEGNTFTHNIISGTSQAIVLDNSMFNNRFYLNDISGPIQATGSEANLWQSSNPLFYTHETNGTAFFGFLGNHYTGHTNTDGNIDGIADASFNLPGSQPDDDRALAKPQGNYTVSEEGKGLVLTQLIDPVPPGTEDIPILKINIQLNDLDFTGDITSFTFDVSGTTENSDITSATLYSTGSGETFKTTTIFGSAFSSPNGLFGFSDNLSLKQGSNYFWLTYDVADGAPKDNVLDAALFSIFIDGGDHMGGGPIAPPGNVAVLGPVNYPGSSISLNGSDQYIDLSSVATHFDGIENFIENFTVEFWMKGNAAGQTDDGQVALFGIHDNTMGNKIILFMGEGNSQDGLADLFVGSSYVTDGSVQIGDNQWHHIAIAQHAGDSISVYVDGMPDGSYLTAGINLSTNDLWSVGQEYDASASDFFEGSIDEVRIWSKALTGNEIRQNMFQALDGNETDLTGYWRLDEGAGSVIVDLTASANNGTLISNPLWSTDTHPYGTLITGTEGWRLMSSPVDGASYSTLLDPFWTQGFTGSDSPGFGDPNVFTWDEASGNWTPLTDAANVPGAGTGFLVYVYDDQDYDQSPDGFPKTMRVDNTQNDGTISPTLSYSNAGVPEGDGWNLVGNPYGATIDWDAASGWTKTNMDEVFYVWSDTASGGAGAYLSWSSAGGGTLPNSLIAPWQGFWVQATAASPALEVTDDVRSAGGVFYKKTPVPQITFGLEGSEIRSKAVVMFHEQAGPGKDPLDAWKLQSLNEQYLSLYTTATDGEALDINALPLEIEHPLELTMNFDGSDLGGEYTLSWNPKALPDAWPQGSFTLTDLHTGQIIALDQAGEYSFQVEAAKSKGSGVQPPSNQSVSGSRLDQASTLEPYSPKRGRFGQPKHGPIPTALRAKAKNPRFLLTIHPNGADNSLADIPRQVELAQNYPNPFNPATVIRYGVPEQARVQLTVYDILGRRVATLINEQRTPGRYQVNFDASRFASGLYIYRLRVGDNILTKKMMLIK